MITNMNMNRNMNMNMHMNIHMNIHNTFMMTTGAGARLAPITLDRLSSATARAQA